MSNVEESIAQAVEDCMQSGGVKALRLVRLMEMLERRVIEVLARESLNKVHLAECLGITRTGLLWKLSKMGITVEDRARRRPKTYKQHGLPRS